MNWKNTIIGSLIGAVAIRFLLIPDIWAVLGLIALMLFWIFLSGKVGDKKKYVDLGFMVVLALVLITTIGLNLYGRYIAPYNDRTTEASKRALLAGDLETALRLNPYMLKSRTELADQVQWLQDYIGQKHAAEMDGVRRALDKNQITTEQAWKIISKVVDDEKDSREKAKNAASQLSVSLNLGSKPSSGGLAGRLALIGAILLGIALIPKVPIPGKKFWGTIGVIILIAGLTLWIFPEISAAVTTYNGAMAGGPPAGKTKGKEQIMTISLHPVTWSDKFIQPSGTSTFYFGPPGSEMKSEATGEIKPTGADWGMSEKWFEGFRFRGPEGQQLTIKTVWRN